MFSRGSALAAFVLASVSVGCMSPEAAEERAVLGAVDALRGAPSKDAGRVKLVEALEKLPATTERARHARDRCAEAYRLLLEGEERLSSASAGLAGPTGDAKAGLVALAEAEKKLAESEKVMKECDEAAARLRFSRP